MRSIGALPATTNTLNCASLLINFVPAGGIVAAPLPCFPPDEGCDPSYARLETVDGWWSGDQRFVFANVNPAGLQYNGSFELDWVNDGVPDGWENRDSRFNSYWAADSITFYDSDVSMKLVQNASIRPTLWQQIGVPDSLPTTPQEYGLVAKIWRRGSDLGDSLECRVSPRDSTGRLDTSRRMVAMLPPSQQRGWNNFSLTSPGSQLLRLKKGDRAIEIRLQAAAGVDTLRIDRLQLLPVVGGQVDSVSGGPQEAVPGLQELLVNGDMEQVEAVASLGDAILPTNWWTSPEVQVSC
jgi:hypothetical protein